MRSSRIRTGFSLALFLVICVYVGNADAQCTLPTGYESWSGLEWQFTATVKGYEFANVLAAPSGKLRGTAKFWGKMTAIDPIECTIAVTLYNAKRGTCEAFDYGDELVLRYLAGSSNAFVAESEGTGTLPVKGLFYLTGKETSKGVKGKVVTLGAYQTGYADPDFESSGLNMKGKTKDLGCDPVGP